jgi:shikimate dehydrogenase
VRPDNALIAFKSLKYTSISGVNVTMPLKREAFLSADARTPEAELLGVANCLFKRDGQLIAHNTDLEGFAAPLLQHIHPSQLAQSSVLLVGAGGASRAVIGALLSLNVPEIRVINRTDGKAESLIESLNLPSVYALPWSQRENAVLHSDIIVNATSGGMSHYPPLDISLKNVTTDTLIYDLVYTPRETPLLAEAKKRGCRTLGGLEMLIAQARPSFRHFFGRFPDIHHDPTEYLNAALQSGER